MAALGELELGLGDPARRSSSSNTSASCSPSSAITDVDLSPAAELVDAYLRLGRADEARARRPPSSLTRRRPRASRGRSPARCDARGCSPPTSDFAAVRAGARLTTRRRPTRSRPPGPGWRTASGCGGREIESARASSCARRARPSNASTPGPGPSAPAPSSPRPVRRCAVGPEHGRRADPAGAADRAAARLRQDDARGRRGAVPEPEDDRVPPPPRLPEAGDPLPRGARRKARRGLRGSGRSAGRGPTVAAQSPDPLLQRRVGREEARQAAVRRVD